MKKSVKVALFLVAVMLCLLLSLTVSFLVITADAKLDETKLINFENTITFYSANNKEISEENNGTQITEESEFSPLLKKAFIAIEDKRFYKHHGIDYKGLFRATIHNISSFSFKEGASTISQQLIKNTHLSSEKTIKRKLVEFKLAKQLEKRYSKDEILAKYLNTIYFGDNCFGITKASLNYFAKQPKDLSLSECATLAGLVKAPSLYSPQSNIEKCKKRRNIVLKAMLDQGFITNFEYQSAIKEEIKTEENSQIKAEFSYLSQAKKELSPIFEKIKYGAKKYKVFLNLEEDFQSKLKDISTQNSKNFSAIICSKDGKVLAYNSNGISAKRQIGSTIKPILVYAPAIEENLIDSTTFILDEPINFSGYSPSNFGENYRGYITAKDALAQSSNVCAVKIFNDLGFEKSANYARKMNINLTDSDKNLGVSLGVTENGLTLKELVDSYSIFLNGGNYIKGNYIEKITDENDKILYVSKSAKNKVFSEDTIEIMNDVLEYTAECGTAKKLSNSKAKLCAKTGTVGTKNGNTDAYCVSYNEDFVLGIWHGNLDGSLMGNFVTGGNCVAIKSKDVWDSIYKDKNPPQSYKFFGKAKEVYLDKISLENQRVEIADNLAPKRFLFKALFKENRLPKEVSTRFTLPKVESAKLSVINKGIYISLCQTELCDFCVFKQFDNKKIMIFDSKTSEKKYEIFDKNLEYNKEYIYSIIPYYFYNEERFFGKEFYLKKVKIQPPILNDNWWLEDNVI